MTMNRKGPAAIHYPEDGDPATATAASEVEVRVAAGNDGQGAGRRSWMLVLRHPVLRPAAWIIVGLAVWAVAAAILPRGLPVGTVLLGALVGGLNALTAVGLVIIYRSTRIINFSQAEIGGLAATFAILLVTRRDVSYFVAMPLGLLLALATGALVEVLVVRRFFRSPRLILTVATIGVAQILTAGALALNNAISVRSEIGDGGLDSYLARGFGLPFDWQLSIKPVLFNADAVLVVAVLPLVLIALSWFLNRTDSGIGTRAAADSQERAELLGIPVRRLSMLTWTVAAGLSGLAVLLTAGVRGYGLTDISGPTVLMAPLAAAVIAKFDKLTVAVAASIGLGILSDAVFWNYAKASLIDAVMFAVILLALIMQSRGTARVAGVELGGFVAVREVRRVPDAVRRLPETRVVMLAGALVVGLVALVLPLFLTNSQAIIFTFTATYSIIGISLVILSGWAGQLTLGQFAFVGIGAATAGSLLVHAGLDYLLCLVAAAVVAGVVAIVIGLPALRIPGMFLAPVTMAFAVAVSSYVLAAANFRTFNPARVPRPLLLERIDLGAPRALYYFSLVCLGLVVFLAWNFRRYRTGRVVVGVRDNERVAASFSISPARLKLSAFAISGAIAGLAGGLYVLAVFGVPPNGFAPILSLQVFAMAVVGGLASIAGGVLGAIYVYGAQYLLSGPLQIAVTGAGMLIVLLIVPGGLAEVLYTWRDRLLRVIATRRGIVVPGWNDEEESSVSAASHLAGTDGSCSAADLCGGGEVWKRVWRGLDRSTKKSVRRSAVKGEAVEPAELAALAAGYAEGRLRSMQKLTPFVPLLVLPLWVLFGATRAVQHDVGFGEALWNQLARPLFWLAAVGSVVVMPLVFRRRAQVAARRNLAIVQATMARGSSVPANHEHRAAEVVANSLMTCAGLDAGYGHLQILFGADLQVRPGEFLAILGTNGAGKTTLLKVLSGILPATRGTILFEGEDITELGAVDRVRKGIVMVPAKGIFGTLTVQENLRLAAWLANRERDDAFVESTMRRIFQLFPVLEKRLGQQASLLSGGEQQMLTIAQALLCRPKLLMIDELSLGLAPILVASMLDVVRELNQSGLTVVVVEQSVNLATTIAERAVFIEKGAVGFEGATNELETSELLRAVFAGGDSEGGSGLADVAAKRADQRAREAERARPEEPEPDHIVRASALRKRFGGVVAVADFTLDVRRHEVLGIIGSNGAGKTTVFDIMSGFLKPDGGRLLYDGVDVTGFTVPERAALGFGRTFQDVRMMPSLTALETLEVALERSLLVREPFACVFGLDATRRSESWARHRADELLSTFGLSRWRDSFVADLSTGTRRILEIACAAAHEPRLLLFDEPTSGLAQREAEAMAGVLLDLKERIDATVMIIEHDVPLVSAISDELICMDLGMVVARGSAQQVLSDPRVITSYLGGDEATINRSGSEMRGGNGAQVGRQLSVGEFAALRGISPSTVRRHIRAGRVVAERDENGWRIPATELDRDLLIGAKGG